MAAPTAARPESDHAGVRFPPPLLYGAAIGIGSLLERTWPLPIVGGALEPVRPVGAALLLAAGVGVTGAAIRGFRAARTSLVPVRPATALVVAGPYRFTRNPMYLGLASLTAGVALLVNSAWVLVLLAGAVAVTQRAVILPEERYLQRRFGDSYRRYCAGVRRWL